jgi:hypothetical protein
MKTLTRKKAIELAILKWEAICKDGGIQGKNYNKIEHLLEEFPAYCAFCKYYKLICTKCLIGLKNKEGCCAENHPFDKWCNNNSWINAKAVLNLIKSKQ